MKRMHVLSLTSLVICYCLLSAYLLSFVLLNQSKSGCDQTQQLMRCSLLVGERAVPSFDVFVDKWKNQTQHLDGSPTTADMGITADTDPASSLIWSHSYPSRTFEDQFPSAGRQFKPVIILTYQRCGSSFLGNLFNFDKNAFYVFEPLDSLYSSLYGTAPGWNVPSDIFADNNGQPRPVPYDELIAVAEFLGDLLSCDVDRLPTELLAHGFWHIGEHRFAKSTAVSNKLASCTRRLRYSVRRASARLAPMCGKRLSDRGRDKHDYCWNMLHSPINGSSDSMKLNFIKYRETMNTTLRQILNTSCIPIFRSNCSVRPLRVAKVVRASMLSMVPLMDWLPDLRVIHLIRDPRPVALSRRDFHESARGVFSESTNNLSERTIREASIYCRQVVADIRWRQRLERRYPGRLYSLTYEQLVDDPVARASDIFRFIEERPSESVLDNFAKLANGDGNKTAKYLLTRWLHDRISHREFDDINEECAELFQLHPEYSILKPKLFRNKELVIATRAPARKPVPDKRLGRRNSRRNISHRPSAFSSLIDSKLKSWT